MTRKVPSVPNVSDPILKNFLSAVREGVNSFTQVTSESVNNVITNLMIFNALGYTPENTANKSNNQSDSASTSLFPSWSAVSAFVATQGFASVSYVASQLSSYATLTYVASQLSSYATLTYVASQLSSYATLTYVASQLSSYASSAITFTNKRNTRRVIQVASTATPSVNTDNCDIFQIRGLAVAITGFTMTGTPNEGDALLIEITGTAARAITWGSAFEASTVALPTTTVSTNKLTASFLYNGVTSKWRCIGAV